MTASLLGLAPGCGSEHSTSPTRPSPGAGAPGAQGETPDDTMKPGDETRPDGGTGSDTPGPGPGDNPTPRPKTAAAHQAFWAIFRAGEYPKIAEVLGLLGEAVAEDGQNATTHGYIGYLYTWRVSESARATSPINPLQDVAAARQAFERAVQLDPSNARLLGFMASMAMTEGQFTGNPELRRKGEEAMAKAVEEDPEFNLFTAGYTQSLAPFDSPAYTQAVDQQWEGLERCLGFALDRANPSLGDVPAEQTMPSTSRACGEAGLAPHNLKGFMLNMGDMVVKAGNWQAAQKLYEIAKASQTYDTWAFRSILEARIQNAQANVPVFRAAGFGGDPVNTMMFSSRFSCMGCHQITP